MTQFKCGKPADVVSLGESSAFVNTGMLLDYGEPYTIDLWKQARMWISESPAWTKDELFDAGHISPSGQILSLPVGVTTLRTYLMIYNPTYVTTSNLSYLSDTFTLTWLGTATVTVGGTGVSGQTSVNANTITFAFDATSSGAYIYVDVTPTNPADMPRWWSCIPDDHAADHAAGYIFRRNLWTDQSVFAGYRLMKFGQAETSPHVAWADRTLLADEMWTGLETDWNGVHQRRGPPIEAQIAYANESGQHPWFCVPFGANDDYVTNMAEMIRDTLDAGLICFVEYANENWNFTYSQTSYGKNLADTLWGVAGGNEGEWHGMRSTQIMGIFTTFFAGQMKRLRRVMATHVESTTVTNRILAAASWQAASPGAWVDPKSVHDYLAITGYFGGTVLSTNHAAIMTALGTSQATGVSLILDTYCPAAVVTTKGHISAQIALANAAGLKICMYENNNHLNLEQAAATSLYSAGNPAAGVLDMMQAVYQDARMEALKEDIRQHFKLAGGTFDCVFGDYSSTSKYFSLHWKRHAGDTTTGSTGLASWVAANPRWFHY